MSRRFWAWAWLLVCVLATPALSQPANGWAPIGNSWSELKTASSGGGSGTVTSVGSGTIGPLFSVSWATATTTPALSLDLASCTQNRFLAGPVNAPPGVPTCRVIDQLDLPAILLTSGAMVSGILPSANGGTGNGFAKFTGPATSEKTFTLPNATCSILTDNALVSIAQGGTGASALTNHGVVTAGASALTTVTPGTSGNVLTSNGTDWTSAAASGGGVTCTSCTTGLPAKTTGAGALGDMGAAPTTADSNADTIVGATAAGKKVLVLEAKATPTQPPFQVKGSDGTPWVSVNSDGGLLIDQRTVATWPHPLSVSYQGSEVFSVGIAGQVGTTGSLAVAGGFFAVDTSGNALTYGNVTAVHYLGFGTAPTVSSCGTSPAIVGKDFGGKVTIGSAPGTSCTVPFGTAYTNAPACWANDETTAILTRASTTTTTLTLSGVFIGGDVVSFGCHGF